MCCPKMSESDKMKFCACCGTAGGDDIKLKKCTACYLVKYCSVKCQKEHRPKHKRECKKRAAELRDELLFKQPESSSSGDCPICCLPLPIDPKKSTFYSCCSNKICMGCSLANQIREIERRLQQKCPFCREVLPSTDEERNVQMMKRVEANDPVAMCQMGTKRCHKGDYKAAFEYWTKAVALGDVEAHHQLSIMYREGIFVVKDWKRALYHMEEAAIGGHPDARHNLAYFEDINGQHITAVKHYVIAAKLGFDDSLKNVKTLYEEGRVSKDVFSAALLGYQAAIEATKSPQREEAAENARRAAERDRRGFYQSRNNRIIQTTFS